MDLISKIGSLVKNEFCCLRCAGRAFGQKNILKVDNFIEQTQILPKDVISDAVPEEECTLCKGLVKKIITLTDEILLQLKKREFASFLIGCLMSKVQLQFDQKYEKYGIMPIDLKHEIIREVGLRISNNTLKTVNFSNPDITILIDTRNKLHFKLQIKSVYILGRYCKLIRGIPQTKWPCSKCKGKGCTFCHHSGQQYPSTVEGIIASPFIKYAKSDNTSFHGAGREDIDALMLGDGRPFVLEIKNPLIRSFDLDIPKNIVNSSKSVKITDLRFCNKEIIKQIKNQSSDAKKTYLAVINCDQIPLKKNINKLVEFGKYEKLIQQRTPLRVSHRRADKIRIKKLFKFKITHISNFQIISEITAQGGMYIKEFISGDKGRTNPCVSSILDVNALCIELNVLSVDDKGLFNKRTI